MSLRNRLVLPVILSALAVLAACGGSSPVVTPPPTGGFSNSNLNGTYVFSVTGSDSFGGFLTIAGTFIANGSGRITGGVIDVNGTDTGVMANQAVTSGSYGVGADGRPAGQNGLLTLVTAAASYSFDYVLTSGEHGLITEYDGNTGSGTLDLQANVTQANINGQSYAFNLTGTAGIGTVFCNINFGGQVVIPFATAGAFTLDASGNATGVEDFNNNCNSTGLTDLPIVSGSGSLVSLASVPGTAVLATSGGTFTFDVFPVSATHLKFIEVDGNPVVSGDAFTQTSSIPTNSVFAMAGFDNSLQVEGEFATAGVITTDGNGNITSGAVQDINDFGGTGEITSGITGTFTSPSGGRSLLTFTSGFVNGNNGAACSQCQFAAYPSSGGVQVLEIDSGGMTDGTLFTQGSSATLATGQGYGLNLSGTNLGQAVGQLVEEDDIAEFTNNNGTLGPGIIDFNDGGAPAFDNKFSSTYAADSTVAGRGVVTAGANSYNLVTYGYGTSDQVVVSIDPNFVGVGFIVEQNASAKSNAAISHMAVLRLGPGARKALKKRTGR